MSDNPFAALINSTPDVANRQENSPSNLTKYLEQTFGFTLNESRAIKENLLYLEDQAQAFPGKDLDLEVLEHALFERLFLTSPENYVPSKAKKSSCGYKVEEKIILYLYYCYENNTINNNDIKNSVNALILRNVLTAFKQPDLYENQQVFLQFFDILKETLPFSDSFFAAVYEEFMQDEGGIESMREPYTNLFKVVHMHVANTTLMTLSPVIVDRIKLICSYESLAVILLEYSTPKSDKGFDFANTLLGALCAISVLPKTPLGNSEFFQNALDMSTNAATENVIFTNTDRTVQNIHDIFLILLKKSANVRNLVLTWFGKCLRNNRSRAKLWNMHSSEVLVVDDVVSDGFMLNLCAVFVKLCQPFCQPQAFEKILKVDPTYCGVPDKDGQSKGIHLPCLREETCLLPCEDDSDGSSGVLVSSANYNFVTECFFMAHKSLELGFNVLVDKIYRLNDEMVRFERTYNETVSQSGQSNPLVEQMKTRMNTEMSRYLSMKAALSEPNFLETTFHLISSTCYWLCQVLMNFHDYTERKDFIPLVQTPVKFPLDHPVPDTLKCIPEFLVENIVTYLVFIRRFNPKLYEMQGYDEMKPILTFVLMFMGSSSRVKNPHMRARLAEGLEALLPFHKEENKALNSPSGFQREMLFISHEHRAQIVPSLLEVFVGIEMTGQSVAFEQKFNYRRPMYMVMDYLWEIEEHQLVFSKLAKEAEENMEAVQPPLFLRFINLLINDAIFLLDEALANMSKLKDMELARESGAWDRLPMQERAQNMGYFQHIRVIARFDNILGKDTIQTLERLTSKITSIFTHYTMVDRIAAMLNYFLLNLVGPNQKKFKVKDQKEYSFDPAGTVKDICKIYVNLQSSDEFCLAVSQDGRSYNKTLFKLAQDVLVKIGGGSIIGELQEVEAKVVKLADANQATEDAIADAPDNFLDPIMSTLMTDPVLLPSSKQIVDRSTIARHLLSDQTDPFNRSPLTMDQVVPQTDLAEEIRQWLQQKKSGSSGSS